MTATTTTTVKSKKRFGVIATVLVGAVALLYGVHWMFDGYRYAPAGEAIPSHFEVKETFFSKFPLVPTSLQIVADGKSYGYVTRAVGHLTTTFALSDQTGHEVARGANEIFSLLTTEDVKDGQGKHIGTLSKEVTPAGLFTKAFSTYSISNAAGERVATSDKSAVVVTDFILKDATTGQAIVTMSKGYWMWNPVRTNWNVMVSKPGVVDSRLVVMITAFKTYADNSK